MKTKILPVVGIALCAGLMLTGCGKIKMKSTDKKCISNMKQMATTITCYYNDCRGAMPSPQALVRGKYLNAAALDDPKSFTHCPGCGAKYVFLIPENTHLNDPELYKDGKVPSTLPILECPGHGHKVFADGHVR